MKNRLEDEVVYLQQEMVSDKFKEIIGESPAINYVLNRVEEVAERILLFYLKVKQVLEKKELQERYIRRV